MKSLLSVFVAFSMLSLGCADKKPVLEGNYDLVAITLTKSEASETSLVSGKLQLTNNDYNFTMTLPDETANFKGKFSVKGNRLTIESYFVDDHYEQRLSKRDQFMFDIVFTQKDGVLYLDLISIKQETHDSLESLKLTFKKK